MYSSRVGAAPAGAATKPASADTGAQVTTAIEAGTLPLLISVRISTPPRKYVPNHTPGTSARLSRRKLRQAGRSAVARGEDRVADRPLDPDLGIVPGDARLPGRVVVVGQGIIHV